MVSRSKTVNPPNGDLVLSGVSIYASPYLDILGMKFDSRHVIVDTSVLLRCYNAFILTILEYCSPVWGVARGMSSSASRAPGVFGGRLCLDQTFLSLCHRQHVAGLFMVYTVYSNSNHCFSVSFHLLLQEFDITELRLQLIH